MYYPFIEEEPKLLTSVLGLRHDHDHHDYDHDDYDHDDYDYDHHDHDHDDCQA